MAKRVSRLTAISRLDTNQKRKSLTRRTKSEILTPYRGGLCLQFFPHQNRRAFLSAAALHSPQLLSFLFALIIAQTHGRWSLPRFQVRAAPFRKLFRTSFHSRVVRIALRPPLLLAANHSAIRRVSRRTLSLLQTTSYQALHLTVQRRWSASPASLRFLHLRPHAANPKNVPNIFFCR